MIHKQLLKEVLINTAPSHQLVITGWYLFKQNYIFMKR